MVRKEANTVIVIAELGTRPANNIINNQQWHFGSLSEPISASDSNRYYVYQDAEIVQMEFSPGGRQIMVELRRKQ